MIDYGIKELSRDSSGGLRYNDKPIDEVQFINLMLDNFICDYEENVCNIPCKSDALFTYHDEFKEWIRENPVSVRIDAETIAMED